MAYSTPDFDKALDHYVFTVANRLINSVDQPMQSVLIDLIDQFTAASAPLDNSANPTTGLLPAPLTHPWQEVLSQPIDWRSVHREWLLKQLHRQLQKQGKHVAYLEDVVWRTQQLRPLIEANVVREPYRSNLLHHLERSLSRYQRCLSTALAVQQFNLKRLNYLQRA